MQIPRRARNDNVNLVAENQNHFRPHALRGYLYVAAAGFCWGLAAVLGKAVFTGRGLFGVPPLAALDPEILSQTRTTISFLLLAPWLLLVRGREGLSLPRVAFWRCILLGALGLTVSNFFYYYAIARTSVATAIIVQYTAPIWVLLYMVSRGSERVTPARVVAVMAAVAGIALVIGVFGPANLVLNWIGIGASLLAAFGFAFYNVYGRGLVQAYERWRVVANSMLGAALFWLLVNPPWKIVAAHYSGGQWLFMLIFALLSMLLPFSFYFAGLHHLDATRAIVTSCLEPVFAILLAAGLLGESFHAGQAVGMAMVLAATIIVQKPAASSKVEGARN